MSNANQKNLSFEQKRWLALQSKYQNSTNSPANSFGSTSTSATSAGLDFDFQTPTMSMDENCSNNANDSFFGFGENSSVAGAPAKRENPFGTTSKVESSANDPFDFGGNSFDFGTTDKKNSSTRTSSLNVGANDPFSIDPSPKKRAPQKDKDPFTTTGSSFNFDVPSATPDFTSDTTTKADVFSFDTSPPKDPVGTPALKTKPEFNSGVTVRDSAQGPQTPASSRSHAEAPTTPLDELEKVSNLMKVASAMMKKNDRYHDQSPSVYGNKSFKSKSLYPRRLKRRSRRLSLSSRKLLGSSKSNMLLTKYRTPIKPSFLRERRSFASPYSGWSLQRSIRVR